MNSTEDKQVQVKNKEQILIESYGNRQVEIISQLLLTLVHLPNKMNWSALNEM
jgi:hypothetical protein